MMPAGTQEAKILMRLRQVVANIGCRPGEPEFGFTPVRIIREHDQLDRANARSYKVDRGLVPPYARYAVKRPCAAASNVVAASNVDAYGPDLPNILT